MKFIQRLTWQPDPQPGPEPGFLGPAQWIVKSITSNDGSPHLILKNEAYAGRSEWRKKYPFVCTISFRLRKPRANGLASLSNEPSLRSIEDRFFELLEDEGHALITAIITTKCIRQYQVYTNELSELALRLNCIRKIYRNYHFITCQEADWNWELYRMVGHQSWCR